MKNKKAKEILDKIKFILSSNPRYRDLEAVRISIPDYILDTISNSFNMKIESKTIYGVKTIPSFDNKITIFRLDSPITRADIYVMDLN